MHVNNREIFKHFGHTFFSILIKNKYFNNFNCFIQKRFFDVRKLSYCLKCNKFTYFAYYPIILM